MKKRTLTESERTTITNGLRVAAERFEQHVKDLRDGDYRAVGGVPAFGEGRFNAIGRLSWQFETQAKDSRELAGLIEGCEAIEISPCVESPVLDYTGI